MIWQQVSVPSVAAAEQQTNCMPVLHQHYFQHKFTVQLEASSVNDGNKIEATSEPRLQVRGRPCGSKYRIVQHHL
jgi:hypothetical protein